MYSPNTDVASAAMNAVNPKGNPVPVRFREDEQNFLSEASKATGYPTSELVRRAVRLLMREKTVHTNGYGFVVDLAA